MSDKDPASGKKTDHCHEFLPLYDRHIGAVFPHAIHGLVISRTAHKHRHHPDVP
jgi:hypothetical protein